MNSASVLYSSVPQEGSELYGARGETIERKLH
jgi:hypothetical protein